MFLQKLLLAHGRWGYRRVGHFICYYFYKNVILVFCELYFAFFNGFSGQIFFADWLPMLYNVLWTSWPCIFAFVFERVSLSFLNNFRMWMVRLLFKPHDSMQQVLIMYFLISKSSGSGCCLPYIMDGSAILSQSMVLMGSKMRMVLLSLTGSLPLFPSHSVSR
jgi:magnesium-transporting ATPase (P-type)